MKRGIYNFQLILCGLTFCILIFNSKLMIAQWIEQYGGTKENLNDVVMLDSTTAIAIGSEGSILKTTNSGKTWYHKELVFSMIMSWNSISFSDKLNGAIAGKNYVFTTTTGGETWSPIHYEGGKNFTSIFCINPSAIYVGDDSGNVHLSIDSGKTWTSENLTTAPIISIFYYAAPMMSWRPIYVLTANSVFYTKSSSFDGWKEEYLPITNWGAAVKGNNFKYGDPAFIVGYDGQLKESPVILRKTYPDTTWQKYTFPAQKTNPYIWGSLNDVAVPTLNTAFTCGDNGIIMKTSDKGNTWFFQFTGINAKLNAVDFYNENSGVAVGDSGKILITTIGGTSHNNVPPSPFHLLSPLDEDTIRSSPKSILFRWEEAIDSNKDAVEYTLLISADTCSTWKSFNHISDTQFQVQLPMINIPSASRYFWTVIANDGMLATPALDVFTFNINTVSGITNNENSSSQNFALYQNYPNPFNPTTKIKYTIPQTGSPLLGGAGGGLTIIQLKIYDILGKEVATLVDEKKSPGKYEVQFNGNNLPSGIYFYRLQAGSYSDTKKLILLK